MLCPSCEEKTKVLETRQFYDKNFDFYYMERRRECLSCAERFFSIEIERHVWQRYINPENETS